MAEGYQNEFEHARRAAEFTITLLNARGRGDGKFRLGIPTLQAQPASRMKNEATTRKCTTWTCTFSPHVPSPPRREHEGHPPPAHRGPVRVPCCATRPARRNTPPTGTRPHGRVPHARSRTLPEGVSCGTSRTAETAAHSAAAAGTCLHHHGTIDASKAAEEDGGGRDELGRRRAKPGSH